MTARRGLGIALAALLARSAWAGTDPALSDAAVQAEAARLKAAWGTLTPPAKTPPPFEISEDSALWVRLTEEGLPGNGLTSSSPVGQAFTALTGGFYSRDRRIVTENSLIHGQVIEAAAFREDPFSPARLKLFFHKIEDAGEKRAFGVEAVCDTAEGWEVSSAGTILGHREIELPAGQWIRVKLVRPAQVHLEDDSRGIGVWGEWRDGRFCLTDVSPGSSAHAEGLAVGDEITEIDGKGLDKNNPWPLLYGKPGSAVSLKVLKAGKGKPERVRCERGARVWEGTGMVIEETGEGIRVARVVKDSPAEKKVPVHSVLLSASGQTCAKGDFESCRKALALRAGNSVSVTYLAPGSAEPATATLKTEQITETIDW